MADIDANEKKFNYQNEGLGNPLLKLCFKFENSSTSIPLEEGCRALKFIDDNAKNLGKDLRAQLYNLRATFDTDDSLTEHVVRHGIMRLLRTGFTMWPKEFGNYLARQAKHFTEKRIKINRMTFFRAVFGIESMDFRSGSDQVSKANFEILQSMLYDIIGKEESRQRLILPSSNAEAMRIDSDLWKVFWIKSEGTSLQSAEFDFSVIKNSNFKTAFKYWLIKKKWREKETSFRGATFTGMVSRAFNFLSENAGAATPSAVNVTHVRKLVQYLCIEARSYKGEPLALSSVRGHFKVLNQMFDWLMRAEVVVPDGQGRVKKNPFRAVSFKNEKDHMSSADYIPEEVVMQLLNRRVELPDEVNRCLVVMMELGLRYQDAVMLEEGCLSYDEDLGMHLLTYIQFKTKNNRIKRGISPYHEIGVKNLEVVRAIQEQERASADLRSQTGTKLIFVKKPSSLSSKVNVLSAQGFVTPIRMLILKNNITDHDGNLWKFKSHQCRKTVAIVMVENRAKPIEVRQFLGHLNQRTTDGIYAEVRKLRQGELNHEFFEKKFQSKVALEQLSKFSDEERRVLYAEFALGQRYVELGQCLKHASDGYCGKRSGETNCATCKHLCTGPQFEPKWLSLVESQEGEVAELEAAYAVADIPASEYSKYREYQKASRLLREYRVALVKIQSYKF